MTRAPAKDPDEESVWVERLRAGDPTAFDAVYAHYRPRVFAFLARLSGDRFLAEDLMQETFMRLARRARTLRPDTRLAPWLFTVARNLDLDRRRRAVFLDRLNDLSFWPTRPRRAADTPFDLVAASESEARLERALLALPDAQREAVLLCCVEGFEPSEAATMVGVTGATLRQRLRRGRDMLHQELSS